MANTLESGEPMSCSWDSALNMENCLNHAVNNIGSRFNIKTVLLDMERHYNDKAVLRPVMFLMGMHILVTRHFYVEMPQVTSIEMQPLCSMLKIQLSSVMKCTSWNWWIYQRINLQPDDDFRAFHVPHTYIYSQYATRTCSLCFFNTFLFYDDHKVHMSRRSVRCNWAFMSFELISRHDDVI